MKMRQRRSLRSSARRLVGACSVVVLLSVVYPAIAQFVFSETILSRPANDIRAEDLFGGAVAIEGDTVVVGAWGDGYLPNPTLPGAVYVYTGYGTGTPVKLTPSGGGSAGDQFGRAVAIEGNRLVVGANLTDIFGGNTGAVYVFERDSRGRWSQKARLTAWDARDGDRFGSSVALEGDTLIVGAWGVDDRTTKPYTPDVGAAYVYVRNSKGKWVLQAQLKASDRTAEDKFGWDVAMSGNTVVVGAYGGRVPPDIDPDTPGAAYVFVRSGTSWSQQQKLTADPSFVGDNFGSSVAIDGDTLAVGECTFYSTHLGWENEDGAAYVFTRSGGTWSQQQKLTASDGMVGDNFGAVALHGDTLAVGAWYDDGAGAVYLFTRSGGLWTEQAKLVASDRQVGASFGAPWAVAVDATITPVIVVGARGHDTSGITNSGAAYVYH